MPLERQPKSFQDNSPGYGPTMGLTLMGATPHRAIMTIKMIVWAKEKKMAKNPYDCFTM
jgi:hypothetical protein